MFSELLSNSGERIFIQAIDQCFELELSINDSVSFPSDNSSEIEASLENLNVKFCESLDSVEEDRDNSTEVDSEDSLSSELPNKKTLTSRDLFNISSDFLLKEKERLKIYYTEQVELINKIKAIFFKEKPNVKNDNDVIYNPNK